MSAATTASEDFCPPFNSDEELNSYLKLIAPPRELVCPITQELLKDPVVAEDGHTYERNSLVTWYEMGRTRSPVTNALLENTSTDNLVTNLAVTSLANLHRLRLGKQLIDICIGVKDLLEIDNGGGVGVRVDALLDAGADPNTRGDGGNTPLHLLIKARSISLANQLLNHEASVCNTNDTGLDCIATAEQTFSEIRNGNNAMTTTTEEWNDFIQELKRRETVEKARLEARDMARSQANDEHRERQRSLAANARTNAGNANQGGFGRMGEGVGYFPSLATLQFQSSIPGPSPSVAEYENKEKERLNAVLKWMCFVVLVYFLFS